MALRLLFLIWIFTTYIFDEMEWFIRAPVAGFYESEGILRPSGIE